MIKPIQYLRAIAALMVVWHHALGQIAGTRDVLHIPAINPSGVYLFFVISGFIMFVTTTEKPLTPIAFLKLRIVRVVPLYWLITLLMVGVAMVAPSVFKTLRFSPEAVIKSLLFIPYDSLSVPGNPWPVLIPGWSLNFEMFFYALFALALLIPPRLRLTALLLTLVALVAAGQLAGPFQSPVLAVYTSPMLMDFCAGAVLGQLWMRRALDGRLALSIVSLLIGVYLMFLQGKPPAMDFWQMFGAVLVVAGSLHPAICALKSRLLLVLGDASYSIYLTHVFTLGTLRALWPHLFTHASVASAAAFMVVAMSGCAVAGCLVYRWIEQPMTTRLRVLAGSTAFKAGPLARAPG